MNEYIFEDHFFCFKMTKIVVLSYFFYNLRVYSLETVN